MMPAHRSRLFAVAALAVALVAFPLGALGSHQFADVPASNIYHADIDALADSGVTTGCGGGLFCPSAFVTREQMAAFMNRLGALAPGKTPVVNADRLDGLTSSQFLRSDVAATGHARCVASAWQPDSTAAAWAATPAYVYSTLTSVSFRCPLELPNGATINLARWLVRDSEGGGSTVECALRRTSGFGSEVIASELTGGTETPGTVVLESVISPGEVVDTDLHDYVLDCLVQGTDVDVRCR